MLEPLIIKNVADQDVTLLCTHREDWPPAHARLPSTPDQLRAAGAIDEVKHQQLQTWEKHCGLMKMEASKCSTCPLALHKTATGQLVAYAPAPGPKPSLPFHTRARKGRDLR